MSNDSRIARMRISRFGCSRGAYLYPARLCMSCQPAHDRQLSDGLPVLARGRDEEAVSVCRLKERQIVGCQHGWKKQIDEIFPIALAPKRHHKMERTLHPLARVDGTHGLT